MSDAMTAALIDAATKAEHDRAVRACALLVVDARVKLLGELAEKVAKLEPFARRLTTPTGAGVIAGMPC